MNKMILKNAAINSGLTVGYILMIVSFMTWLPKIFGPRDDSFWAPVLMLSLFVFSAAVTGSLVVGRPLMWYLDGKKKEAVMLLGYTLATFFAMIVAGFAAMYLIYLMQ